MTNAPLVLLTTFETILFYSYYVLSSLLYIIFSLVTIALFTVVERKIMAALQKRKGPNVHGLWGSLQAFADGLKLLLKEDFVPSTANAFLFRAAPIYTFFIALSSWAILPFSLSQSFFFSNLGILYIFALSSLGVYGIILSGWASNSKYSFLGSLRSAAQMISYEVSLGFIIITLCMLCSSLSLTKFVLDQVFFWFIIPFFPLFFIFFISIVAETNRAPFDLPEAEAELVSGYNVEYGGISFALFFLAEYSNIILMSTLLVLLFLGGWWPLLGISFFSVFQATFNFYFIFWLSLKVQLILGIFVWLRVSFPRYRYDQLMFLGWNVLLPFSLSLFFSYSVFLFYYDCLPAYQFYVHPNYMYYCEASSTNSQRFFYYWDRIHEFDQIEDNQKENIALSDINNYKDEIKKKSHFFERSYWQKLFFIDISEKYSSNFNSDRKKIISIISEYTLADVFDVSKVKIAKEFSIHPGNFVFELLQVDDFFCSKKQCFVFFVDPNFSISDVYMKFFYGMAQDKFSHSAEFLLSSKILFSCHETWNFLYSVSSKGLLELDIYHDQDHSKALFYLYNLKNKLPMEVESLRQACLTLQLFIEKYRYLEACDGLIKANEALNSLSTVFFDNVDEEEFGFLFDTNIQMFNHLLNDDRRADIEIFKEDLRAARSIECTKKTLTRLKENIEAINVAFFKNKQMISVLRNVRESGIKGEWMLEINVRKSL